MYRYSVEEFYYTLFTPIFEKELKFVESVAQLSMAGIAEIGSSLDNEHTMIPVDVKEVKMGTFHSILS